MSDFHLGDLTWRARASYTAHAFKAVTKQHHKDMLPFLAPLIGPEAVVFDVGGHMGQFAKLFAGLATGGRVFTFEPSAYARSILGLALRLRRLANVTAVNAGLAETPGTATLTTPLKAAGTFRYGLAHLGKAPTHQAPTSLAHAETCAITTIDRFMEDHGLARLDFIKIDVEGWEHRVLLGGAEAIRRHRPPMMIELVDHQLARAGDDLPGTWARLLSWGYAPMLWRGGATLEPIQAPRDGDAVWLPG